MCEVKGTVDVLLIEPPISGIGDLWFAPEPISLGYLASALIQHGLTVEIINALWNKWSVDETIEEIKRWNAMIIGITLMSPIILDDVESIVVGLRSSGIKSHIVLGGNFATLASQHILNKIHGVDAIVLGDGELTLSKLASSIYNKQDWRGLDGLAYRRNGSFLVNPPKDVVMDLDKLPLPYRPLTSEMVVKNIASSILSSRGCHGKCNYCSAIAFQEINFNRPCWRARSSKKVVDEIEILYKNYDVRRFFFIDDNFIGPYPEGQIRAFDIAEEILNRDLQINFSIECRPDCVDPKLFAELKNAGLSLVLVGIESGSQRMLNFFRKNITVNVNRTALSILSALKIPTYADFIFLDPYIDLNEVDQNLRFLKEFPRIFYDIISSVEPRVGTDFARKLNQDGDLKGTFQHYTYEFKDPRISVLYRIISEYFPPLYYQTWGLVHLSWEIEAIKNIMDIEPFLCYPGTKIPLIDKLVYEKNVFTISCAEKSRLFLLELNDMKVEKEKIDLFCNSIKTEIENFSTGFNTKMALLQTWISLLMNREGSKGR